MHAYPHKYIAPYLSSASSFHPTPWFWNRYLETYIPIHFKVPLPFKTKHEIIKVKGCKKHLYDGDVSLTWIPLKTINNNNPPIIIIVPGLTGDINAKYCRRMALEIHQMGWEGVIFNPRGRGGVPFKSPQAYSVGYTEDLRQIILHIHNKYPSRLLFGIGYSLGANYLAKYMGEEGKNALLDGAVCCAAPTDPMVCMAALKKRPIMSRVLTSLLQDIILGDEVLELFKKRPSIQCQKALSCTELRQFDHYVIAPQFGFRSCTEYYRKSAAGYYLMDIAKPTLFLYAKNDITIPFDVCCSEDYDGNPYLCCVATRYGSHSMSWLQGIFGFHSWQADIAIEYLRAVTMLKCRDLLDKSHIVNKSHADIEETESKRV